MITLVKTLAKVASDDAEGTIIGNTFVDARASGIGDEGNALLRTDRNRVSSRSFMDRFPVKAFPGSNSHTVHGFGEFFLDGPQEAIEHGQMDQMNTKSVVATMKEVAGRSDSLSYSVLGRAGGEKLDRFVYSGNRGGGDPIKIGIFAGIHGDEPAGVLALADLVRRLQEQPHLGEGYQLFLYPVCNPSGFDRGTRLGSSGKDLNREFWKNSPEEEVRLLEGEILEHQFLGLISLHSDDTCNGLYGFVRGDVLAKNLLEPALRSAEVILPRDPSPTIDGFKAEQGIISTCYEGILTAPLRTRNQPFEIIFETPAHADLNHQVAATALALETILTEYRKFLSFAADL